MDTAVADGNLNGEKAIISINTAIESICAHSIKIEDEFDDCTDDKIYVNEAVISGGYIKQEPCDTEDERGSVHEINYVNVKDENIDDRTAIVQETVFMTDTKENYMICCEECGEEYDLYCLKCSMVVRVFDSNNPNKTDNRVRQTLPKNFIDIRETPFGVGIIALRAIPEGVVFGPFEGLESIKDNAVSKWKLKNKELAYVKDPKRLNWMQYVRRADESSQQNLIPLQYEDGLYYRTDCNISVGDELLVCWNDDSEKGVNEESEENSYLEPQVCERLDDTYACTLCCVGYKSISHLAIHNSRCPEKRNQKDYCKGIIQCAFCKIYLDETEYSDHHINPCCRRNTKHDISAVSTEESQELLMELPDDEDAGSDKTNDKNLDKHFRCPKCTFATAYKGNLRKHLLFHDGIQPYACEECGKRFTIKATLERHFKIKHTEAGLFRFKPFKCLQCPYETDTKKCLIRHSYIHSDKKPFVCHLCKRGFTCQWSLKIHLKHLHPTEGVKEFKCSICKYETNDGKRLEAHRRHVHPENGLKEFKCHICGYETNDKGRLNQHLRIHDNVKRFKCGHCQKLFSLKSNLKMHIKAVHDEKKDYTCDKCGYQTNRKDGYEKHLLVHLNGIRFWCKICNVGFDCMISLKQHDKENHEVDGSTETDGKKFECKECGSRFGQKPTLEKHFRDVHTKDKKYKCPTCNYVSTREDHVRRHSTVHQAVKPFVCLTCDAGFSSASSLSTHNKRKHSTKNDKTN